MKLIQVYNTFEGEKYNNGFSTFRSLIDFWKKSTEIHIQNYDVVIYTDNDGYNKIKDLIKGVTFEIINFEIIDDRYWNIGKFQVERIQLEPFIYIDIDVILYDIINEFEVDFMTENFRQGYYGKYSPLYGLKQSKIGITCSGLLGFNDPTFAKYYADSVIEKIKTTKINNVTFEAMWHLEELFLSNLIEERELTTDTFKNFIHLQGGMK